MFTAISTRHRLFRASLLSTLLVALLFATAPVGPAAAQGDPLEVPNPSFEEVGDDGLPVGWTLDPPPRAQTAEASTEQARTGERSLRVDDSGGGSIAVRSEKLPATPAATYTVTSWVYSATGDPAWLYVEFFDASGVRLHEQHVAPEPADGWQKITVSGVAPAGTRTLDLLVYGSGARDGVSYYDDVSLSGDGHVEPPEEPPYAPNIGSDKQLFHDDYRIDSTERISRVVHEAEKLDNPVLTPSEPWESNNAYLYGTVLYDEQDEIFKMWYQVWDRATSQYHTLYATSQDGRTWDKPDLGVVEYNGSTANNIIGHQHSATVIKDTSDPDPGRRYKMLAMEYGSGYWAWFSPDGITWTPSEHNPVLPDGDVANVIYDPRTDRFVATTKHPHSSGRAAFVSSSTDFENWTEPQLTLAADSRDHGAAEAMGLADAQIYGMPVASYEGVYVGFPWIYYLNSAGNDGPIDTQLAFSRDLTSWVREDRRPVIPRGIEGSFDSGMNFTASDVVVRDDRILMYYGGWDGLHGSATRGAAIGLASWRLDGFASMANGGDRPGTVTTKPLIFDGDQLAVNADIEGSLRVEVLDAEGDPVPGLGVEESVPFSGDDLDAVMEWESSADLGDVAGEPVRLRFHLDGGHLYAYQFTGSTCDGTIEFDGADSGVEDFAVDGQCATDVLGTSDDWPDQGSFVRHVSEVTDGWRAEGLITSDQRGAIVSAAGQSS